MRIVIVGLPGSGKTTLAKTIAQERKIPHLEADRIFWQGCNPLSPETFRNEIDHLTRRDSWIYEGHLSKVIDLLSERASFKIVLDVHPSICLSRMVRREIHANPRGLKRIPSLRRLFFTVFNWRSIVRHQSKLREQLSHLPTLLP